MKNTTLKLHKHVRICQFPWYLFKPLDATGAVNITFPNRTALLNQHKPSLLVCIINQVTHTNDFPSSKQKMNSEFFIKESFQLLNGFYQYCVANNVKVHYCIEPMT